MGASDGTSPNERTSFATTFEWEGAVGDAKDLHDAYESALEKFAQFEQKNADKILLWSVIRELLVESETEEDVDVDDLFKALGMPSGDGRPVATRIDDDLKIERAIGLLTRGASVQSAINLVNATSPSGASFVQFGRAYVIRQVAIDVRAYELIRFLKTGDSDAKTSSLEALTALGPADLGFGNDFYAKFTRYPYVHQVAIAKRLTGDLDKCNVGREFLADLFEYRREAIFDPFGFVPPLPILGEDNGYHPDGVFIDDVRPPEVEPLPFNRETVSVLVKDLDGLEPYYTSDFRLRVTDEANEAAVSFGTCLGELHAQLLPGLGYFYGTRINDDAYMGGVTTGRNEPPIQVFLEFTLGVVSVYATDALLRDVVGKIDGGLGPDGWAHDPLERYRTTGEFSLKDVTNLAAVIASGGDTFFNTLKLRGSSLTTTLKGVLSILVTLQLLTNFDDIGRLDAAARLDLAMNVAGAFADLGGIVALKFRQLGFYANLASVALNGLAAIFNILQMVKEFAEGDDAGIGYGMSAVGAGIFVGFSLYAKSATAAGAAKAGVSALAAGFWLTIAVLLIVGGTILAIYLQDGPFEEWLEKTYFGTGWSGLDAVDFVDPSPVNGTYGYKNVVPAAEGYGVGTDGGNFVRQVSTLISDSRSLRITRMDIGKEGRDGENHWRGHFTIEPKNDQILADGHLFLRPIPVYERSGHRVAPGQFRYADPVSDSCIHRFSLTDDEDTVSLESKTDISVEFPAFRAGLEAFNLHWLLEAMGEHREADFGTGHIDLEIVDVERETNDDDEEVIKKWEAKLWDTSSFDPDAWTPPDSVDAIFGLPGSGSGSNTYYVELIYVPPKLARAMRSDGTFWFRAEELPTVTRTRRSIRRQDGSGFF
ncbi:hypothetical protein [Natronococcus wangiae]|uniref:hypothetical protein n=1 Tax=Natronococcus wangiae TaxID=3068275 RepID=UPI00273E7B29|nr:hypothetical protein [Natronococcus sp. AD5]